MLTKMSRRGLISSLYSRDSWNRSSELSSCTIAPQVLAEVSFLGSSVALIQLPQQGGIQTAPQKIGRCQPYAGQVLR